MKKDNKIKGGLGEKLAEKYLRKQGYVIIDRNYKAENGEVDLIAQDGDCVVFVEVKARMSNEFGYPSEAVGTIKQKKIAEVAAQYIKRAMIFNSSVRFDVVEVYLSDCSVNHIVNAFDSYLRY